MILLQSSWVMELVTWCDVMYLHLKENYSYLHFALVQSKKRKRKKREMIMEDKRILFQI